jgi:hypothetical protein
MASSSSTNTFPTAARTQVDDISRNTMTTLPPLLASSTLNPSETAYARSWYGAEISSEGRKLAGLLKERIPAEDYQRWWQVNQFVCSGKAQNDFPAAFQRRWKNWQVNVEERTGVWDKEPEGGLQNLLVTRKTGTCDALRRAVDLAVDIRVLQSLRDGNHRTALLSLIIALAESDVVIRPTFPIIKAYAVLSARHHEGNADNALDTDAIVHVRHRLFQLLRHAVAPGTATWEYVDARANEIRELPVVSHVWNRCTEDYNSEPRRLEEGRANAAIGRISSGRGRCCRKAIGDWSS